MKSKRLSFAILLAVLITFALPLMPVAAAGNPSANGGGTTFEKTSTGILLRSTFVFNAVKQKNGTVTGHLVYHFRAGNVTIYMDINCLKITGNSAALSGVVTKLTGTPQSFEFVGQKAVFKVVDNGQGKGASPDLISDVILYGGANCNGFAPTPHLPISGNITIHS